MLETVRVRLADGEPVVLEKNHFSMAYAYLADADYVTGEVLRVDGGIAM